MSDFVVSATDESEANTNYPADTLPYENQVAGHSSANGKSSIGMLKHKEGHVLKPLLKPVCADREKQFYSNLQLASDSESLILKTFVPEYLGTSTLKVDANDVEFLLLKNVAHEFVEPCVMDIKIGRQTWDPEATKEKKENEESKYTASKQAYGFCIPGFQVHHISTGNRVKMGKDYGNKLTKESTIDALKLFLNADSGLSRRLLLQLLVPLWRILHWCRTQHKYLFYSSSLLLVYDAWRLRHSLKSETANASRSRPSSNIVEPSSPKSPMCCSPSSPLFDTNSLQRQSSSDSWHAMFDNACRTHSLLNNYEKDLQDKKENYSFQLDDLISFDTPGKRGVWATVKMIDFAHAFPAPTDEIDSNYLEGIENLVKLLECLLEEASAFEY